jgi:hypothetical protein
VEKAWQRYEVYKFREVNRVKFDPQQTSVKQLEERLREAGTYRYTVDSYLPDKGDSL